MTKAPTTRETADHAELARLAEAAAKGEWWSDDDVISHQEVSREDERFIYAFTPAVCSALLSEIAALRGELEASREEADRLAYGCDDARLAAVEIRATQAERQRDEAFGLLRELADGRSQKSNINEYDDLSVRASTLLANQGADQ